MRSGRSDCASRMPASLARDRQAGLDADELFQAAAEQGVIFDYQYRWHVVSPCADALRPGCAGAEMPRLF